MKTTQSCSNPKSSETRFLKLKGPGRHQMLAIEPLSPPTADSEGKLAAARRRMGLVCDAPLGLKT